MLFLVLGLLFIAVIWGVSFLTNLLFGTAARSVDRASHRRQRQKLGDEIRRPRSLD